MPEASPPGKLFIQLYLDAHIKSQLAVDLRQRGFDALTSRDAGMDAASDEQQLIFAAAANRVLLTYNIRDFAPLHAQWPALGRTHAGIVVSQQLGSRQYGILLSRALKLLNALTADEMIGNLVHLEQFK